MHDAITLAAFLASAVVIALMWHRRVLGTAARGHPSDSTQAMLFVIAAVALFFAQVIAVTLVHTTFAPLRPTDVNAAADLRFTALTTGTTYAIIIAAAVLLLYGPIASFTSPVGPRALSLSLSARDVGLALVAFACLIPLAIALSTLLMGIDRAITGEPPDQIAHTTLRQIVDQPTNPWTWLLIAGAVIGAPIFEEVLYRGLALSAWRSVVGPRTALIASTIIFTAVHIGVGPWYALGPIALVGLACGILYLRTARLGPPIILHATFNAANVAMALMSTQ